jgi:prepilin-type N-terminal cleavage/methylation domain-containing protein
VSREGGFSLIEVLVATLILGLSIVPLMQLFPGLVNTAQDDEITTRLGTVAARQMEAVTTSLHANITSLGFGTTSAACADLPQCLVQSTITSEASSATPGVGQLVDIRVIACADANGNNTCDPGERQVEYDAKITSRP